MALIERIIKTLAYALEFDPDYHGSLLTLHNGLRFKQDNWDDKGNKLSPKPSNLKKGVQNAVNLSSIS